ncbi:MAG: hypothetical protein DMF63_01340 [Acidobacteria bacterium]|nr:MAG: hypothetical protein DMF63_01340 [Acidobacteriota bacterium]
MKSLIPCLVLTALCALASVQAQTPGKVFTVDFNGDSVDANVGDGVCRDAGSHCSLRAAIDEANADPKTLDAILFGLPDPSVIDLTLGELGIASPITIVGPGPRRLTVQRSFAPGTPDFRIFHVLGWGSTIRGMTIKNGRITGALFGGGIYVEDYCSLDLTEVSVVNNFALYGGGIANWGYVNVTRSLFAGNRGNNQGGAIYNIRFPARTFRITDSTVTGNSAGVHGAISNDGTMLLVNDTITHNSADDLTTGIASYPEGTVTVLNSIIGSDTSPTLTSLGGAFISLGNNIITDARNSNGFVNGVNNDQVSNNNAIDPLLGPLMNNGGQTDTRALLAGSPAINAGNNCISTGNCSTNPPFRLNNDQRSGFARLNGAAVDVGAFEHNSTPVTGIISLSFGVFDRPARFAGSIAVLTDTLTLEKRYASLNPFGNGAFPNLPLHVYIFEIKSKREGLSIFPIVMDMNDFALQAPSAITVEPGISVKVKKD